jgi:acetyl esterase/lipase
VRTLAVGYRLAPENPFPAALEDAAAAWRFVLGQGVAAAQIAIGGDSAGGGLTLALIGQLRDAGEALPACAWLVSPWTDLTMSGETLATKDAVDPLIHKAYLGELAEAYLPPAIDRRDPRVSPLYADLKGLPPLLIQVGSAETLLADATRFAAAAGEADVDVTLEIWPHMIHAWPLWNARLAPGRQALASAGRFLGRHLDRRR